MKPTVTRIIGVGATFGFILGISVFVTFTTPNEFFKKHGELNPGSTLRDQLRTSDIGYAPGTIFHLKCKGGMI